MQKIFLMMFLLLICAVGCLSAQQNFWLSPEAYLQQEPPTDTPKIFAPDLLADTGIALDRVAFSRDGKEFYYCYAQHWFDSRGAKIKYFKYTAGGWKGPLVLNEGFYAPGFSSNGDTLFFIGGGKPGTVSYQMRRKNEWTAPKEYLHRNYGVYDFMKTRNGNMYIGSNGIGGNIKDFSTYDLYQLRIRRTDTLIKKLPGGINTPGFDGDFFISPDESYIIVSANETKDFECELHISFRDTDGRWSAPKSLGSLINNGVAHRWGQYVTPDNKYLFYTQGTSERDCHIYWVRFDKMLKQLRVS